MNILIVAQSYPPNLTGVSEVARQHAERLAGRGHSVTVATQAGRDWPASETRNGVTVHRFDVWGKAISGIHGDYANYVSFVRRGAWDAVIMHCAQTWVTDALLPHLQDIPGRKVLVLHGLSALCDPQSRRYLEQLAKTVRQSVDCLIGVAPSYEEERFCREYNLPAPTIIPNGIDISDWSADPRRIREVWQIRDRPWAINVSNHSPVKGHASYLRVLKDLARRDPRIRGTIVGNSHPAERWRMGRLGIQGGCWYRCRSAVRNVPVVTVRRSVPRRDVISALQEADVFLLTSSWEASPLVVLEAMAAGTPWVSFDVGCVAQHAGGVVVRTIAEMTDVAHDLLSDAARRTELGVRGRAAVEQHHQWDVIVGCYEQLLLHRTVAPGDALA